VSLAAVLAALLHPELLWLGAAAASVPILIHLLSRRKVRPVEWAAMRWLLAAVRKHQRRLRLENLLILLLRVAALLLLGLGLARVILSDSSLAALLRPKRSLVLLVDTSYSTAAKDGARSVSDRVRAEAEKALAAVGPDDVVVVVASNDPRADRSGTRPHVLLGRTIGREGVAKAREALAAVHPTEAPANWPEVLTACLPRHVLQPGDLNPTLVWVTDLQAKDWRRPATAGAADPIAQALEALAREQVALRVIDAGGGRSGRALGNLSVVEVANAQRQDLFQGHSFRLAVRVANHGPREVKGASLRVFLDDAPAPVAIVPGLTIPPADPVTGRGTEVPVAVSVAREQSFKTAGAHVVRVEVTPPDGASETDAIGLDSRRLLALDVRATLKIACWVESTRGARYDAVTFLKGVYTGEGTGDVFELRPASDETGLRALLTDPAWEPDLVVLANTVPRGAELQRDLVAFVRGGGALMVFVGERIRDPGAWNGAFYADPATRLMPFPFGAPESRPPSDVARGYWRLDLEHPTSNELSKRLSIPFIAQTPPEIRGRLPLIAERPPTPGVTMPPEPPASDESVVLRFLPEPGHAGPGPVAIAEGRFGEGRTLWAGIGVDVEWIGQGVFPFLPILLDTGAKLLTLQRESDRNLLVGEPIVTGIPRDATGPRLAIPGRGEEVPGLRAATSEAERPQVVYERVGTSGHWRLAYERPPPRRGGSQGPRKVEEAFAVNPDPEEGALAKATYDLVRERAPGGKIDVADAWAEAELAQEGGRQGELSGWILLAVLGVLLLEGYLAMRFGHHERVRTTA
jgi:hypothetical protein